MNISLRTLQRKLNKAGLKIPRGHIPPDVQDLIYQTLGWKNLTQSGVKWREVARNGAKNLD